jgi:hypothetical protein
MRRWVGLNEGEERGQAHLPNLRGNPRFALSVSGMPFDQHGLVPVKAARGWEGGLAPLLPLVDWILSTLCS